MSVEGVDKVKKKISDIFVVRKAQLYALCSYYAELAKQEFDSRQPSGQNAEGEFWTSRTGQAAMRVFGKAGYDGAIAVFWALAHGVDYGVYLELANDRRHASLDKIIKPMVLFFLQDVKEIYGQ
jgi:hypothetical protein